MPGLVVYIAACATLQRDERFRSEVRHYRVWEKGERFSPDNRPNTLRFANVIEAKESAGLLDQRAAAFMTFFVGIAARAQAALRIR